MIKQKRLPSAVLRVRAILALIEIQSLFVGQEVKPVRQPKAERPRNAGKVVRYMELYSADIPNSNSDGKTKIHHLDLNQLGNAEYLCFAQQVASLISSAKALHVAESVVTSYKANIAKMPCAASPLSENGCIAIRTKMDDQYEDITATVDAFSILHHRKR